MSIVPSFFARSKTTSKVNAPSEPTDIWDPFEAITIAAASMPFSTFSTVSMDWKETPDAHYFITDVPGLKKDEVKIEVEEEKVLKISGQRTKASQDKNEKWHRLERGSDKFLRSVRLPPNANPDGMKAVIENGVLTVTVPKGQDKKPRGRFIPITG